MTTKRRRQRQILELISERKIATQQDLVGELARRGIPATQSSVSRDVVELELVKVNGAYEAPGPALATGGPVASLDTAGDNLIVVKTQVGLAQPTALEIDRAAFPEIVGTVAGDDTILVAVKNAAAQRVAMKKIMKLFSRPVRLEGRRRGRRRAAARAVWW